MTMKRRIARAATVATIVGASALAVAPAASANTIYPPSNACSTNPSTVSPDEPISFSCDAETFGADEQVTITVTGESGADTRFAMVKLAVSTGSTVRTSTPTGALPPVTITLPANASGVYNIEAISASSAGGTASTTVSGGGGDLLSATGGDSGALVGLLVGGGVLVLGGATVAVVAASRRKNSQS
jgi:hypothetical protein